MFTDNKCGHFWQRKYPCRLHRLVDYRVAGAYSHRPWGERSSGGQPRRHFCENVSVGFIYRLGDLFLLAAHLHAGYGGRVA